MKNLFLFFCFGIAIGFLTDARAEDPIIAAILNHDVSAFNKEVNKPDAPINHKEVDAEIERLLIKTGRKKPKSEKYKYNGDPIYKDKDKYKKMFKKEGREVLI